MEKRPALGKGLSALIPDFPAVAGPARSPVELDVDWLEPSEFQPRLHMDGAALDELAVRVPLAGAKGGPGLALFAAVPLGCVAAWAAGGPSGNPAALDAEFWQTVKAALDAKRLYLHRALTALERIDQFNRCINRQQGIYIGFRVLA